MQPRSGTSRIRPVVTKEVLILVTAILAGVVTNAIIGPDDPLHLDVFGGIGCYWIIQSCRVIRAGLFPGYGKR